MSINRETSVKYSENVQSRSSRRKPKAPNENILLVIIDLYKIVKAITLQSAIFSEPKKESRLFWNWTNLESKGFVVRGKNGSKRIRRDYLVPRDREVGLEAGVADYAARRRRRKFCNCPIDFPFPASVRLAPEINVLYGGRTPSSAHAAPRKLNG